MQIANRLLSTMCCIMEDGRIDTVADPRPQRPPTFEFTLGLMPLHGAID